MLADAIPIYAIHHANARCPGAWSLLKGLQELPV
jgi:hypothetical protein